MTIRKIEQIQYELLCDACKRQAPFFPFKGMRESPGFEYGISIHAEVGSRERTFHYCSDCVVMPHVKNIALAYFERATINAPNPP